MKVSNSRIQCFKSCRRLYQLKYIYGLEPATTATALERGLSYHEGVEAVLRGEPNECSDPKVYAMVEAFRKYIASSLSAEAIEDWVSYKTPSGHTVIGRVDARADDGTLIEHKTTSAIDGAYFQRLEMDEQVMTYMLADNARKMLYTVCATPSIRQKQNETDEEFKQRCIEWFDESKIAAVMLTHTDEELLEFMAMQDAVINEMERCECFYRNPNHCTKWGRLCEYAPICMHYDPEREYIEFVRKERQL